MAIKKFNDYADTKAYGTSKTLPVDGYVLTIKKAEAVEGTYGQYVEIFFDIAEGEYKNYYANDYKSQNSEDKKWRGSFRLTVPEDDGSEMDGWNKRRFKTFTEALEVSNPGYHFDWDEKKFVGKLVGGLFRKEFYVSKTTGETAFTVRVGATTDIDAIRKKTFKLPKDKPLKGGAAAKPAKNNDFMNVPDTVSEEDLPF